MSVIFIHQPDFAPHPSFFKRIYSADYVVFLDDVQFARRGWTHRDKVACDVGKIKTITTAVSRSDKTTAISDIRLDPSWDVVGDLINPLMFWYRDARYISDLRDILKKIAHKHDLVGFNFQVLKLVCNALSIELKPLWSSSLNLNSKGSDRICEILCGLEASAYISGLGIHNYFEDLDFFSRNNIDLIIDDNKLPHAWTENYPELLSIFHYIALFGVQKVEEWVKAEKIR